MAEHFEEQETTSSEMAILKEKGIAAFDVDLRPEEKDSIRQIKIEKQLSQFNYYGSCNEKLFEELAVHFNQLQGNAKETIDNISRLVVRIAQHVQKDFDQESAWVMVRVTLPEGEYDKVARWHKDGRYVKFNYEDNQGNLNNGKLVFNIKGLPTRFAELKDGCQERWYLLFEEDKKNYQQNYFKNPEAYKKEDVRIRGELEKIVEELPPFEGEQAVLYRTGNDNAKIHSEPKDDPKIDSPRIFMSVVPGSADDIQKIKKQYEDAE